MDCSMPGFPASRYLSEFAQTHVHWVGDTFQPSHPLLSPSPPAFNLSQHQGLFQWVSSSHQVARVLELCQGMFNFKGSNMFFFCVLFFKDSLFLINSWKTGVSRVACSSQDWDHGKGHLLEFLSVTPFRDLLLKGNLFRYAPLTQDMECFLAL